MDSSDAIPRKPIRDPKEFDLFVKAYEEFDQTGTNTICCNRCKTAIVFEVITPRYTVHSCECGKFNGSLKGL